MTNPQELVAQPGPDDFANLPPAERRHPLLRKGYNLGYSQRVHEEHLAELEKNGPRCLQGSKAASHKTFDVSSGALLTDTHTQGTTAVQTCRRW
jgi:hypothetical protein